MNCKHSQEKIAESLAAGSSVLPSDVVSHQNSCAGCNDFYAIQRNVYDSIDSGLRSFVNQPVPPSLIPGVRDRLDAQTLYSAFRIPNWSFALVAAVAILAVCITYQFRRPFVAADPPEKSRVAWRPMENAGPVLLPDRPSPKALFKARVKRPVPATSHPAEPDTEVIVLAEERQAFAKFVAEIPEQQDLAIALTRPAQVKTEGPMEIAQLHIRSLEVKPLEASSKD